MRLPTMHNFHFYRRPGSAIDELQAFVKAQVSGGQFADIFNEIAFFNSCLLCRRTFEYRQYIGITRDFGNNHTSFALRGFRIVLFRLFRGQIGAVRIKPFGKSAQTTNTYFVEVWLFYIIFNNVIDNIFKDANLNILTVTGDSLPRFGHKTADNGITSDQSRKDDNSDLGLKLHSKDSLET